MPDSLKKLLILGTGTFAQEIADVASDTDDIEVCGFVENLDRQKCENSLAGLPVYWVEQLAKLAGDHFVVCGLGTTKRSRYVHQVRDYDVAFETIIHPTARVSRKALIKTGAIISAAAVISAESRLGEHVVINRGALIGHHTAIEPFVTVGPGCNIAGNCSIASSTYIGIGATVIDHISIGSNCVIAAGAVVTEDVPDNVMVAGVPAKTIKTDTEGL